MSDHAEAPRDARALDVEPWPASKKLRTSKLALIGREAQRRALLASLDGHRWVLRRTAEEFGLHGSTGVIRAIRLLGLSAEYAAARERGDLRMGPRPRGDNNEDQGGNDV